ncbi:neurotransmitter:Na+ symporter, NSS family [Hathewaya proteolytica DSM 3090]|uniref:Transporter n=1 Tax=Hathewaya proteolytica DSM 3090 TaxID=1121331 RepID=A0A1M6QCL1_9CLOT|nr:sodium-dependent transporter [Hathewaya proteolytica]SHK17906.1 neurotransmitter:Na+ symporter, NSS family [Hathewaya proteolytica DSM 3090]
MEQKKRERFGTKLGLFTAAVGSAIGLGNIWKFPYLVGENGGAAFLLVYLVCVFLIGMPIMLGEFAIGRRGQGSAVKSFENVSPKKAWKYNGLLNTVAAFIILSFYSVITGWVFSYITRSFSGKFNSIPIGELSNYFGHVSGSLDPLLWTAVVLALTCFVVMMGVKKGIERCSKILMPFLFVLLVVLMVRSLTLDGASAGVSFLFKPDFSKLTMNSFLEALGHSFYTLSLAMGITITFGSYTKKEENLMSMSAKITVTDTAIALMAGMVIFPAVFAYGLEPSAGAKLLFVTIPAVFKGMPMGNAFQTLFFILVAIAAVTSTIALMEVIVSAISEQYGMSRKKTSFLVTMGLYMLAIPSVLSFGAWSGVKIFGLTFFDLFDFIASNIMLPVGGFLTCVFIGWVWKTEEFEDEVTSGGMFKFTVKKVYNFIMKYLAPVIIIVIFLNTTGLLKIIFK